ncbi:MULTISPECIES: hypothetical protein [Bacillota]|uniref:hypothetical protein n=1 Tax=Bacillota TaxID=1239 RepID=UPI0025701E6C|nr:MULTISPECIES: hypothetical protein [Bacillota]
MKQYKITIKVNDSEFAAGSIFADKLVIKEGRSSSKIRYIDLFLGDTIVYGHAALGKVEVIEENEDTFEIIING